MPTVFRQDGWRFFFYSNEGDPREPVHIHVLRDTAEAKFWLYPAVAPAYNHGLSARELRIVSEIVIERRREIEEAWHVHFG
ncbi:DUF4160 domain-containing protein [Stakelama tenebrarum]|uniref:DUF4160 domain-containing protein n=1 Tax=Stakelama tenebrarum TaxID=2711215 RepID=A0A6G6Y1X9_9SPHN|nr:DUF4160 domain-containing protein [Sphingosinithalassobacter tenebrarum]QIG78910.1 DUF4160 domain-containing protein [Sphingosinithalassobacter tenebrarum]